MTDQGTTDELERRLEQVLSRRASVASVRPDLATVARNGAVRRRRLTVGAAVAAAAVIAAGIALPQSGLLSNSAEPPAAADGDWESLSTWWTDRTALHYAGHEVPIRQQLRSVVETAEGVVYTTERGDVHALWKDGTMELIGERAQNLPMSSLGSSLVAWTVRDDSATTVVRYDMESGTTETLEVERDSFVTAVGDASTYVYRDEQTYEWTGSTDPQLVRLPGQEPGAALVVLEADDEMLLTTGDEPAALYLGGERADWFDVATQFPFMAVSTDGRSLAVADNSEEGVTKVSIWNVETERQVTVEGFVGAMRDMRWDTAGTLVVTTEPEGEADDYEFTKTQAFACEPDTGSCRAVEGSDVIAYELPQVPTDATWQFGMFIGS